MGSPWSGLYTSQLPALNNRHRLKQLRKFLGDQTLLDICLKRTEVNEDFKVLDIGAKNYISQELGITEQTVGDLNDGVRPKNAQGCDYDLILFLETLNHLQNHLVALRGIHALLKPKGILILSTPRPGIFNYSHGKGNYVEIKERNVIKLLEYCGFRVLRKRVYRSYPFSFMFMGFLQPWRWFFPFKGDTIHHSGAPKAKWYFFGIRPPLKWLLHKYILIEAEKVA